jgi:hypothetical protein
MKLVELPRPQPTVRIPEAPEPNFPELADFPTDIPIHPRPKLPPGERGGADEPGEESTSNRQWPPPGESTEVESPPLDSRQIESSDAESNRVESPDDESPHDEGQQQVPPPE